MAVYGHVTEKVFISVENRDDYTQTIQDIKKKISSLRLSDKEEAITNAAFRMFSLDIAVSSTGMAGKIAVKYAA